MTEYRSLLLRKTLMADREHYWSLASGSPVHIRTLVSTTGEDSKKLGMNHYLAPLKIGRTTGAVASPEKDRLKLFVTSARHVQGTWSVQAHQVEPTAGSWRGRFKRRDEGQHAFPSG